MRCTAERGWGAGWIEPGSVHVAYPLHPLLHSWQRLQLWGAPSCGHALRAHVECVHGERQVGQQRQRAQDRPPPERHGAAACSGGASSGVAGVTVHHNRKHISDGWQARHAAPTTTKGAPM